MDGEREAAWRIRGKMGEDSAERAEARKEEAVKQAEERWKRQKRAEEGTTKSRHSCRVFGWGGCRGECQRQHKRGGDGENERGIRGWQRQRR